LRWCVFRNQGSDDIHETTIRAILRLVSDRDEGDWDVSIQTNWEFY
jgi:hypothetical protein